MGLCLPLKTITQSSDDLLKAPELRNKQRRKDPPAKLVASVHVSIHIQEEALNQDAYTKSETKYATNKRE